MKRIVAFITVAIMILALCACGETPSQTAEPTEIVLPEVSGEPNVATQITTTAAPNPAEVKDYPEPSPESNFKFTLNDDGKSYSVEKANKYIKGDLVIPMTYNGLPVTEIKDEGFSYASYVTSIIVPPTVTKIGNKGFYNCDGAKSITIYEGITSIGKDAFAFCEKMTELTIPSSVTEIGQCAFANCYSVKSAVVPDGFTELEYMMFYKCTSLESVTLPATVTFIGGTFFSGCEKLTSITFKGTKAQWKSVEKDWFWNENTPDYTVHCTDGDVSK